MTELTTLLLADGRLPAGGHAHSAGAEVAVARGWLRDEDDLAAFVAGRLATTGTVDAALAAATVVRIGRSPPVPWPDLDAEASARVASPALRATSRRLGRQLLRTGSRIWPSPVCSELESLAGDAGPHRSVALGAVAAAAELDARAAATCAVHDLILTVTSAAVRLLGLDPVAAFRVAADVRRHAGRVVDEAVAAAHGELRHLPAPAAPLLEIAAEDHARWEVRLFAS